MKRTAIIVAAVALVALAVHARVIAGQTWDDVDYHVSVAPPRLAAAAQIHAGAFPRWWDGASWGVPLWAEPSHGAGAPLVWLATSPHALDLVLVLYAALLAIGVGLWARRAGASELAAIAAGVLVATTGVVTSAALRGALPGIAPLPWIGWAALGLSDARTRGANAMVIALGLGIAALAGDLAAVIDGLAIAILVGGRRATAGWLAAAIAAGLAIGAAMWLPALATHGAGAQVYGIGLPRLVELLVPGAFGSMNPARGISGIGGGAATAWPSLFLGAPLLALALAYRGDGRARALVLGCSLLALVVGRGGWPAGFGAPEVHVAALAIALAVRAARGADAVLAGERRVRIALGIAAGAAVVATWFMIALRDANTASVDRALFDGGIGALALGAAAALLRRSSTGTRRRLALALALVPGLVAARSTEPTIDAAVVEHQPRWVTDGLAMFRKPPRRAYRAPMLGKTPDGDLADALATLAGESAARYGIGAARTDDPARSPDADAAFDASSHNGGQLLERLGVGLAVLPRSVVEKGKMRELDPGVAPSDEWSLAQYPGAPPAVTVADWQWVPDAGSAFKTLFPLDGSRGVSLDRGVLIGSGPAPDADGIHHATTCDVTRWDDAAIDLACGPPSAAYAVVSSSAEPGWTATVDGAPAPWVVADGLRRAVHLDRGKHQVLWRYRVPMLDTAIAIAVLGILLAAALAYAAWRPFPRSKPSA